MQLRFVIAAQLLYLAVAFGWRSWLQHRRTGSTGFKGLSGKPLSLEWWGGVLLVAGFAAAFAGPLLALTTAPDAGWPALSAAGWASFALGFAGTVLAQLSMGDSWRIGVDADDRTTLVTRGLFQYVRNPIFTSMLLVLLGIALLVPGWLTAAALAVAWLGLELQVRFVEEPYLRRTQPDWVTYAARVGRFLPGIGLVNRPSTAGRA